jgi:hypothetical protein
MWIKTQFGNLINLDNVRTISAIGDYKNVYVVACSPCEKADEVFNYYEGIVNSPRVIAIFKDVERKEAQEYIDKLAAKLGAEEI